MKIIIQAITIILICVFMPVASHAQSKDLAVGIASDHIGVTVGFTGSSIELFGDRRDETAEVAIIVEGPEKHITIWKKERIMGTWVNRHYAKFNKIPVYYHYAISADHTDDAVLEVMLENGIGHDALFHRVLGKTSKKHNDIKVFQKALLKKSSDLGIFFEKPAKIKFFNDNFFRVSFDIPPSAPTGQYKIHSFLIKNGEVVDRALNLLMVEQVGLNAFIYEAAHKYSLVYAMACISLALFFGWLVSVLRVRP